MNNKAPIMVVAGTRPEAIKLAPIIEWLEKLDINYVYVWSGQHYDYEMSQIFFDQLNITEPDLNLGIRSSGHSRQTAKIMIELEKYVDKLKPSIVLAQGDTNTVAAAALSAAKSQIPFAHVEAGLRSWDRSMPEEVNRVIADAIAELYFAPTILSAANLMHEGVPLRKISITGNTIVDIVYKYMNQIISTGSKVLEEFDLNKNEFILVTIHRQENTDSFQKLKNIIKALIEISKEQTIVFPIHPRTIKQLKKYNLYEKITSNSNIRALKPLGYLEFLGLLMNASLVLTDSGGVQEEACIMKVPTLTLRYNTERPETVIAGINKIVGTDSETIVRETLKSLAMRDQIVKKAKKISNFLGDGRAGKRIAEILKNALQDNIKITSMDTRNYLYITYLLTDPEQIKKLTDRYYEIIALYDKNGLPVTDLSAAHKLLARIAFTDPEMLFKNVRK